MGRTAKRIYMPSTLTYVYERRMQKAIEASSSRITSHVKDTNQSAKKKPAREEAKKRLSLKREAVFFSRSTP